MKRVLFCISLLLFIAPAFAQSPTYPPTGSSTGYEQWPGALHNDQSFSDYRRDQARQVEERQRVEEVERENTRLKQQLENRQRYEKASEYERRTLDVMGLAAR